MKRACVCLAAAVLLLSSAVLAQSAPCRRIVENDVPVLTNTEKGDVDLRSSHVFAYTAHGLLRTCSITFEQMVQENVSSRRVPSPRPQSTYRFTATRQYAYEESAKY